MSKLYVPVEVSARHVHLSQAHLEVLFGAGYKLQVKRQISQPGQYASVEKIKVKGPLAQLDCRVVGPVRQETQVELSISDCKLLGVKPVLRVSGSLDKTAGVTLGGPAGTLILKQGVIVAQRHLHISPKQAAQFGLRHGDVISIATQGSRPVTFHDVFVRSREGVDALSFMLDTDEANAAGLRGGEQGLIVS